MAPHLIAQCTGADCPLPLTLPWYFTAVIALVWLAGVAGTLLLGRRWLTRRRRVRSAEKSKRRTLDRSDRGTDVEIW